MSKPTLADITVEELKWLVSNYSPVADTVAVAIENTRRATADATDFARQGDAYRAYEALRAKRRREAGDTAVDAATQKHRNVTPPSRQHALTAEAQRDALERFEREEPLLAFYEWIDAGEPEIHRVGGTVARAAAKAKALVA